MAESTPEHQWRISFKESNTFLAHLLLLLVRPWSRFLPLLSNVMLKKSLSSKVTLLSSSVLEYYSIRILFLRRRYLNIACKRSCPTPQWKSSAPSSSTRPPFHFSQGGFLHFIQPIYHLLHHCQTCTSATQSWRR